MADYSSYKSRDLVESNFNAQAFTADKLGPTVRACYTVKWVYGSPSACSPGCCCAWVVPTNVRRVKWEIWGAGGNGSGACSCNRCQHYMGSGGGTYNTKHITSAPGCTYTVCAGGVYRCYSRECGACNGCTSYVNGFNLSGFCACGGGAGCANGSWTDACFSYMNTCRCAGTNNGEMAGWTHYGPFTAAGGYQYPGDACHCWKRMTYSESAAFLHVGRIDQYQNFCWIRCGCWSVPYAAGGQLGMTSYCGSSCCGQGGTGGSGVVKITYY